jgi:hypothetical protein
MNEDLEKLKNLLAEISYSGDQSDKVLIEENDQLATLKKAIIRINSSKDWFAFSPDKILSGNKKNKKLKNIQISPLLTSNSFLECKKSGEKIECHHNKTCDTVIFLLEENKLRVIFIELKSSISRENYKKAVNQIKSTEQFVNYLMELASKLYQIKFKIIPNYIVLHKPLLNKIGAEKIRIKKSLFKEIPIHNGATIFIKQLI